MNFVLLLLFPQKKTVQKMPAIRPAATKTQFDSRSNWLPDGFILRALSQAAIIPIGATVIGATWKPTSSHTTPHGVGDALSAEAVCTGSRGATRAWFSPWRAPGLGPAPLQWWWWLGRKGGGGLGQLSGVSHLPAPSSLTRLGLGLAHFAPHPHHHTTTHPWAGRTKLGKCLEELFASCQIRLGKRSWGSVSKAIGASA